MIEVAQAKMEYIKRKSREDLFLFTKYVLGYNLLEPVPHKEVCDFIVDQKTLDLIRSLGVKSLGKDAPTKKKLLMLPRGTFKSTIATVAFPLFALMNNPELSIMIDNEAYKNSKRFLAEAKGHIKGNKFLQEIAVNEAGEYLLEPNDNIPGGWTEDSVILKHRKRPRKEPSIFCSGVDTVATGMHPHIIIMDDLVSERNVTTDDQIEKTKQHYRFAYSLLEPGGILIVIGTRYHMFDLYSEIIEDDSFEKLIRPAILPNGKLFFPSRLGYNKLEELKRAQGIYIFNSQYMLNPLSSENAIFKEEWFKWYTPDELPKRLYYFITVDLAISQKETADYTVVNVAAVDPDNQIWEIEYRRGRFTPQETADHIFELYDKYKPLKVGVESVAWQKAMIYFLRDEMRKRGKFIPLAELKADKDKQRRALGLQPWFENGAFFMPEHLRYSDMHRELLEFPLGKHDDTVDALAYLPQIMRRPARKKLDVTTVHVPANIFTGY